MDGIRLNSRCFRSEVSAGVREIVDCLAPEISQLYCASHGNFLIYSSGGISCSEEEVRRVDREYAFFLVNELYQVGTEIRDLKLFRPGFLKQFRDYLYGDWNSFYLFETEVSLGAVRPWTTELPRGCKIFIRCVDASYWEVYVESPALLRRLWDVFVDGVPCRLEDGLT